MIPAGGVPGYSHLTLGQFIGKQPSQFTVPSLIKHHMGIGQEPPIETNVFAVNVMVHMVPPPSGSR